MVGVFVFASSQNSGNFSAAFSKSCCLQDKSPRVLEKSFPLEKKKKRIKRKYGEYRHLLMVSKSQNSNHSTLRLSPSIRVCLCFLGSLSVKFRNLFCFLFWNILLLVAMNHFSCLWDSTPPTESLEINFLSKWVTNGMHPASSAQPENAHPGTPSLDNIWCSFCHFTLSTCYSIVQTMDHGWENNLVLLSYTETISIF